MTFFWQRGSQKQNDRFWLVTPKNHPQSRCHKFGSFEDTVKLSLHLHKCVSPRSPRRLIPFQSEATYIVPCAQRDSLPHASEGMRHCCASVKSKNSMDRVLFGALWLKKGFFLNWLHHLVNLWDSNHFPLAQLPPSCCRSFSEFQETAQYLSGMSFPEAILQSLTCKVSLPSKTLGIINCTPYDCWLERAVTQHLNWFECNWFFSPGFTRWILGMSLQL